MMSSSRPSAVREEDRADAVRKSIETLDRGERLQICGHPFLRREFRTRGVVRCAEHQDAGRDRAVLVTRQRGETQQLDHQRNPIDPVVVEVLAYGRASRNAPT
jgi:hypothetical protein